MDTSYLMFQTQILWILDQHFYWQIGGFQIHAQVLITSWVVITILLGSVVIAVWNPV